MTPEDDGVALMSAAHPVSSPKDYTELLEHLDNYVGQGCNALAAADAIRELQDRLRLHEGRLDPDLLEEIELEVPSAFYEERRFEATMRAMQGLAAGLQWTPQRLVHENQMAEDAVAIADALLAKLGITK